MTSPLIALISAVPTAMAPVEAAFAESFPQDRRWNLLDDRLMTDATAQGGLTPALHQRMERLIAHAVQEGADAILLTCSLYGPVAHDVAADTPSARPLLAPDDAVFAAARSGGFRRVLVVSSGAAPLQDSVARLRDALDVGVDLVPVLSEDAASAARANDAEGLVEALAAAVERALPSRPASAEPTAVLLAQFSLAPAAAELERRLGLPVLAGPQHAVALLHRHFTHPVPEETS